MYSADHWDGKQRQLHDLGDMTLACQCRRAVPSCVPRALPPPMADGPRGMSRLSPCGVRGESEVRNNAPHATLLMQLLTAAGQALGMEPHPTCLASAPSTTPTDGSSCDIAGRFKLECLKKTSIACLDHHGTRLRVYGQQRRAFLTVVDQAVDRRCTFDFHPLLGVTQTLVTDSLGSSPQSNNRRKKKKELVVLRKPLLSPRNSNKERTRTGLSAVALEQRSLLTTKMQTIAKRMEECVAHLGGESMHKKKEIHSKITEFVCRCSFFYVSFVALVSEREKKEDIHSSLRIEHTHQFFHVLRNQL